MFVRRTGVNNNTVTPLLDFSEAIQKLVNDSCIFSGFLSYFNGEINVSLKAGTPHTGLTLGVH